MHHLPHLRPSGVLPPPSISPQGQEPAAGTASCRKLEAGSSTEVLLDTLCTSDTGEALAFRGPQTHLTRAFIPAPGLVLRSMKGGYPNAMPGES